MKNNSSNYYVTKKNILMLLILFFCLLLINKSSNNEKVVYNKMIKNSSFMNLNNKNIIDNNCMVTYKDPKSEYEKLLNNNMTLLEFYSNIYKIDINIILNDLKNRAINYEEFNEYNLGFLTEAGILKNYQNKDLSLIDYFEEFIKLNPQYVNNNIDSYEGNNEYIEKLIRYFTNIYSNVNYKIALSIGAAESGYFKSTGMLKINNIYGGMSNGKLISYKNIEYGVLKYVQYLDKNYFSKGINTIDEIGAIYCPTFTSSGIKVASTNWLNLVNKAMEIYNEDTKITIEDLK